MSNYELGVIVPVYEAKEADDIVCWKRPPKSYETGGDLPWVGTSLSIFRFLLLTSLLSFRVNLPCSMSWTRYKGLAFVDIELIPVPTHRSGPGLPCYSCRFAGLKIVTKKTSLTD